MCNHSVTLSAIAFLISQVKRGGVDLGYLYMEDGKGVYVKAAPADGCENDPKVM